MPDVAKIMDDSIAVVRRHRDARTLLNEQGKITDTVLRELAAAGYWVSVMWTCDSLGWNGASTDQIIERCGQPCEIPGRLRRGVDHGSGPQLRRQGVR